MRIATAGLVIATLFSRSAEALLVGVDSPCEKTCGNVLSATTGDDMVCNENGFGSSAGVVFQTCTNCELGSTYSGHGQTDLQWLLHNLRFAVSWCLFGFAGNNDAGSNPCTTSTACGPLREAFEYGNLSTSGGAYDYCQAWIPEQVAKCSACLLPGDQHYLNNYMVMLDAGCQQKPAAGATISVEGSPFSTVPMNVTTPTPSDLGEFTQQKGPISLGGKVGIAIGGIVLILFVIGFGIVCNGRRRRRAFLHKLEMRHKDQGWPHPSTRGGGVMGPPNRPDLNDTPLSQKPLRGWDDSPMSATTNSTFPRYFSPYSSQYNSPVSAVEGPNMQWPQNFPSSAQEKALQEQHEAQQSQLSVPMEIGVALGGSEPSIRTQPSNPSFAAREHQYEEAYEMHEVDSAGGSNHSGRMPNEPSAPVLHHPGFGRQHSMTSFKSRTYGGLTEEDARRGNAL